METERLYKVLFYVGSGWNFVISITLFLLVSSLPSIIGIEPPRYPLFIYFDLMSIFFFGCIQWIIARNLYAHRSFVKMLVWAKLAMGAVLLYSIFLDAPPKALTGFLAPGVVLDVTGTWESVLTATAEPVLDPQLPRMGMTVQAHVARGRHVVFDGRNPNERARE